MEKIIVSKTGKEYKYDYSTVHEPFEAFTSDRVDYPQLDLSEEDENCLLSFLDTYIFDSKEQKTRFYEIVSKKRFYFYIDKCNYRTETLLNSVYPQYHKAVMEFITNLQKIQ